MNDTKARDTETNIEAYEKNYPFLDILKAIKWSPVSPSKHTKEFLLFQLS